MIKVFVTTVLSISVLQLAGCKSIVNDYAVSELDSLNISLKGDGEMRGGRFVDNFDDMIWTCPGGYLRLAISTNGREAATKLEFNGKYFKEKGTVQDNGTVLVQSDFYNYNLNVKVDLKRQAAKANISKMTNINSGCQSEWFDLELANS